MVRGRTRCFRFIPYYIMEYFYAIRVFVSHDLKVCQNECCARFSENPISFLLLMKYNENV